VPGGTAGFHYDCSGRVPEWPCEEKKIQNGGLSGFDPRTSRNEPQKDFWRQKFWKRVPTNWARSPIEKCWAPLRLEKCRVFASYRQLLSVSRNRMRARGHSRVSFRLQRPGSGVAVRRKKNTKRWVVGIRSQDLSERTRKRFMQTENL
jgi:hypothetical protein